MGDRFPNGHQPPIYLSNASQSRNVQQGAIIPPYCYGLPQMDPQAMHAQTLLGNPNGEPILIQPGSSKGDPRQNFYMGLTVPNDSISAMQMGMNAQFSLQPPFASAPVLYHPSPTAPMAGYLSSSLATQQALMNAQVASSLLPPYYVSPSPCSPFMSTQPSFGRNTTEGLHAKLMSQRSSSPNTFGCWNRMSGCSTPPVCDSRFTPPGSSRLPSPSLTPTLRKPTPTKAKPGCSPFTAEYLSGQSSSPMPIRSVPIKNEIMSDNANSQDASSSHPPPQARDRKPTKMAMPAKPQAIMAKAQPQLVTPQNYPYRPLKSEHPFSYHPYSPMYSNPTQKAHPTPMMMATPKVEPTSSTPLRLPEPTGSFESHLSSLSRVITATFGQPEQMSINHQKLAQISQQSVLFAVAQQHRELVRKKETARGKEKLHSRPIVIKEEGGGHLEIKSDPLGRRTPLASNLDSNPAVIRKIGDERGSPYAVFEDGTFPVENRRITGVREEQYRGPVSKKDVYSFESEGDDGIGVRPVPGNPAALSSFKSKLSTLAHRKKNIISNGQPQTKFVSSPDSCARAVVFNRKGSYDMFDFLASKHREPPRREDSDDESSDEGSGEEVSQRQRRVDKDLHMVMQFYSLKDMARRTVGVYRSKIHRRGVFAKKPIEGGEMIIEYAGELIRSVLTDKREQLYKERGVDCYMFKIDEDEVVDATMHGNAARFINHSCDPNCFSKCIEIFGKKHIVIYSQKRIKIGEELTYDYKFPKEEVKVPCTCGARKCRRYLN